MRPVMHTHFLRLTVPVLCLLFLTAFGTASMVMAQNGTVQGTVTDADTGETIPSATIGVAGTTTGTAANFDGEYSLTLAPGTYTLEVRSTGYESVQREITLGAGETIVENFTLEETVTELGEVTVETAGRREEMAQDAPASVSILSAEQVVTDVGSSSVEALRNTTSIDMQQTGVDRRELVIRGFNNAFSGATYVLTDYRQASVASLGVNIYSIMPNMNVDVDRIEVVRGPGSALYGAGVDAGVVHFFTKDPFSYPGTTISLMGGERSSFGGQFRHAGTVGAGNRLGYKLTGVYAQAEDWHLDPSTRDSVFISQEAIDRNPDYSKYNVNGSIEYRFSDEGALIANAGVSRLDATVLSGIGTLQADNFGYQYGQLRFQLADFFAQVYVNMNDAGGSFVYGQDFDSDGIADPVTDNGIQIVANAQNTSEFGDGRHYLVYGVDADLTRPDTEGSILGRNENNDNIDEYGVYAQATSSLTDQLDLTLALRGDYNTVQEKFQVSPRAAVVYQPIAGHSFRATYNRAFSSPGTNSNFLDIVAAQVGGITVRGRGAADGYTWERDPSLAATFGTDLVATSLLPNILGESTGTGAPLGPTYGLVYAGIEAIPIPVLRQILNDSNIPVTDEQTQQLVALLHPDQTVVEGQSVGLMAIPSLSGGDSRFVNDLVDIRPLEQTITQTFEVGYRGVMRNKLLIT
ncbi:MAG: TonB-dependent receptor, partial [Rhodothermales bacterium]|nr:TonB-dependent receptor [Rhodothermales bacterium]